MADTNPAIDILNDIVSGMTGTEVTGLESIYFFLIFTLLFSISFAATAYVPMFRKKEEEYKNIRVIIALSIAFLTTISSYAIIVNQLQIFGLIAAIALGISIAILIIIPKDKREKPETGTTVMVIGIISALLIFYTFIQGIDWITPLVEWVASNYSSMTEGYAGYIIIFLIVTIIVFVIVGATMASKREKEK